MRPLRRRRRRLPPRLRVIVRTSGLNLTEPTDMVWLGQRIEANAPTSSSSAPSTRWPPPTPPRKPQPGPSSPASTTSASSTGRPPHRGPQPHAAAGGTRPMRPYGVRPSGCGGPDSASTSPTPASLALARRADERQWPSVLHGGGSVAVDRHPTPTRPSARRSGASPTTAGPYELRQHRQGARVSRPGWRKVIGPAEAVGRPARPLSGTWPLTATATPAGAVRRWPRGAR